MSEGQQTLFSRLLDINLRCLSAMWTNKVQSVEMRKMIHMGVTFPFNLFSIIRLRCGYEPHYSPTPSLCSLLGSKFLVGAMNNCSSCCMLARSQDMRLTRGALGCCPGTNSWLRLWRTGEEFRKRDSRSRIVSVEERC